MAGACPGCTNVPLLWRGSRLVLDTAQVGIRAGTGRPTQAEHNIMIVLLVISGCNPMHNFYLSQLDLFLERIVLALPQMALIQNQYISHNISEMFYVQLLRQRDLLCTCCVTNPLECSVKRIFVFLIS